MTRRSLSALALATALLSGCGHAPLSLAQANLAARTAALSASKAHHLGARMDGVAMMKDDEGGGTAEDLDAMEKASLPASADLRAGCYPTIRNQGYTEGCVGFATAALFCSACAWFTMAVLALISPGPTHLPLLAPILSELAVTVVFYVPGAYVVGGLHRRIVGPLRSDF